MKMSTVSSQTDALRSAASSASSSYSVFLRTFATWPMPVSIIDTMAHMRLRAAQFTSASAEVGTSSGTLTQPLSTAPS